MEATQNTNPVQPYLDKFKKLDKMLQFSIIGAVVVFVGLLMPAVSITVFGASSSYSFWQWNTFWSAVILAGVVAAAYFTYKKDAKNAMYAGAAGLAATVVCFVLAFMDVNNANSLGSNEYAALASAFKTGASLGFGWILVAAGYAIDVYAYLMDKKKAK